MHDIKDKVFIVTGGAAGIGAAVTRAFLVEEAKHVAVLDLDVASGKTLEAELSIKHDANKIKFHKCDVTTKDLEDGFDAVVKEYGYIDCVVNCAGIMNDGPKLFVKEIEINVTALIRSSMKAYELMHKERGGKGGTIVNISSVAGLFRCSVVPIYAATKTAVLQFSNCLGMEPYYPRSGVRVLTICFGVTDTSILHSDKYGCIDKETDNEKLLGNFLKLQPVQKPESAAKGLIEAYKRGDSASTWMISADKPAQDISENVKKGFDIMSTGAFDS